MATIFFETDNPRLTSRHAAALKGLSANVARVCGYDRPVLIEGAEYAGIWLECGPLEGAVYAAIDPRIAIDNHRVFFRQQRKDGYLPCWVRANRIGSAQIQMAVPIAATAWEVHRNFPDREFLEEAYCACARWDDWLARHRDTRGTGLCEAFCEYDTGQDNSPRFRGLPKACPNGDAAVCPKAGALPYVAPDLSASVYGGRLALAGMADALGRSQEAGLWREKAERTRRNLLKICFDPESACFYDLDAGGRCVRVRGDALTRVLGEGVAGQDLFETIYARHIRNPRAFWTPYPLPSIAADDPGFDNGFPRNSWGGASQALTALRAPRWFDRYGRHDDLTTLMRQWVRAISASDGFRQQINPWTGEFSPGADGYSPCMLVMLDFVARLHGIRQAGGRIEWNCLMPEQAKFARYVADLPAGPAELIQENGRAVLRLNGRELADTSGRGLVTDCQGRVIGTALS